MTWTTVGYRRRRYNLNVPCYTKMLSSTPTASRLTGTTENYYVDAEIIHCEGNIFVDLESSFSHFLYVSKCRYDSRITVMTNCGPSVFQSGPMMYMMPPTMSPPSNHVHSLYSAHQQIESYNIPLSIALQVSLRAP